MVDLYSTHADLAAKSQAQLAARIEASRTRDPQAQRRNIGFWGPSPPAHFGLASPHAFGHAVPDSPEPSETIAAMAE